MAGEVAVGADTAVARLLPWLLNYLLHSTVLLLSALVVTAWLRHRVRMAEILWRAALITPFLTATLASIRPAGQAAIPGGPAATVWWVPSHQGEIPAWMGFLIGVWLVGAPIGLARLFVARARLSRLLASRQVADRTVLRNRLPEWSGDRIRISISRVVGSPVALGFRELCLPELALTALTDEELRAVVAHEMAHLERRDAFWLGIGAVLQCMMFVQPLNLIARRRLRDIAEYLCDDRAAQVASPVAFASALATVAAWTASQPPLEALAMMGQESLALRRVRRILNGRGSGRSLGAGAILLLWAVPLAGIGLWGPRVGISQAPGGRYTITAFDDAGPFTVTLERGRVLAATMDGQPIPAPAITQAGPQIRITDPAGRIPLELTLTAQGGLAWKSRPRSNPAILPPS